MVYSYTLIELKIDIVKRSKLKWNSEWFHCQILNILWHFMAYLTKLTTVLYGLYSSRPQMTSLNVQNSSEVSLSSFEHFMVSFHGL